MRFVSLALVAIVGVFAGMGDVDPSESFVCEADIPKQRYEALLAAVETRYGSVADVRASFVQYSYFAGLDKGEKSFGDVRFRKPGMMDWHYQGPEIQRFISDGKTMWFHQPEDNQVTIAGFSNSFQSELPVSFLLGLGKIKESFKVLRACTAKAGKVIEMTPIQEEAGFQRFRLLVRGEDYVPIGAQVLDVGGNETTIRLAGVSLNSGLKEAEFAFNIPKGVDIIDRREASQSRGAIKEKSLVTAIE